MRVFKLFSVVMFLAACLIAASYLRADSAQQVVVSATPASIILPSPLPLITENAPTATLAATATPPVQALLEALSEANVRAQPDPDSERLGTIRAGELYTVIGRYFRWYQFRYEQSPSGTGWVFDELVRITGDESTIIDLNEQAVPTTDTTAAAATATIEVITQTPGGILTATAQGQSIQLPSQGNSSDGVNPPLESGILTAVLPTFTYPPDIPLTPPDNAFRVGVDLEITPTTAFSNVGFLTTQSVPPILPIVILGGLGMLGLLLASRR
jgi:hypothetical protein